MNASVMRRAPMPHGWFGRSRPVNLLSRAYLTKPHEGGHLRRRPGKEAPDIRNFRRLGVPSQEPSRKCHIF